MTDEDDPIPGHKSMVAQGKPDKKSTPLVPEPEPKGEMAITRVIRAHRDMWVTGVERGRVEALNAYNEAAAKLERSGRALEGEYLETEKWIKNRETIGNQIDDRIEADFIWEKTRKLRAKLEVDDLEGRLERAKMQSDADTERLRRKLDAEANPPKKQPRSGGSKLSAAEAYAQELEESIEFGATGMHGKVAAKVIAEYIEKKGGQKNLTNDDWDLIEKIRADALKKDNSKG